MNTYKSIKGKPNIYKYDTKHGTKYSVRRKYYDDEQVQHEYSKGGFDTIAEAKNDLSKFENNYFIGNLPKKKQEYTLNNYFNKMLKSGIKNGKWQKNTVRNKKTYYNRFLKKRFGNIELSKITRRAYQDFINELILNNFAKYTIQTLNQLMQSIMNDAEVFDVIDKNKLRKIDINGGREPRDITIQPEEYEKWLATAENVLNKYQFSTIKMLTLGERREELLGLKFESFEFKKEAQNEICKITFDTARTESEIEGGPLKNASSYRSIFVDGDIIKTIHYLITESKKIYIKNGHQPTPSDFLILDSRSGNPLNPRSVSTLTAKVSKKSGIHMHPHMFRHYFATVAKSSGRPDVNIMRWLGHARVEMTNSYVRPTEENTMDVYRGVQGKV